MADIIQLLPDSIANQIAAGEVIQRPASVVKELLENSIDAGGKEIRLIIKDAGKTLIQVIDNGSGMSETDARMAFERHATSKVRSANDLFSIRTMGFRGEALASIAAIAHVELITRLHDTDLATRIVISGSEVTKQEACQAMPGTSFAVKNLFFNVPARRKFLKSDPVELKHIMDAFNRVALANPEIFFSMYHNDNELYHLPGGTLRQRILGIFGKKINDKLIPITETTEIMDISGFVGKPEYYKKSKGEQYIFVNRRFIKSNYLNHAIRMAYEELIPKDHFPFYVLFLDMDPAQIDINVHPTKTEIKFEEERLIYNYIKVSVKHSIGQYSLMPTIDFGTDYNFGSKERDISARNYAEGSSKKGQDAFMKARKDEDQLRKENLGAWESIYGAMTDDTMETEAETPITLESKISDEENLSEELLETDQSKEPYQIHSFLIVSQIRSGFILIDQQSAHERILYEHYLELLKNNNPVTQKVLFPKKIELDGVKATLLKEILPKVNGLGFEIASFGKNDFLINGIPAGLEEANAAENLIEKILEQYEENMELDSGIDENIAGSLAMSACIKRGKKLDIKEMKELIDQLFACTVPYKSPSGRKCFITMDMEALKKRFID